MSELPDRDWNRCRSELAKWRSGGVDCVRDLRGWDYKYLAFAVSFESFTVSNYFSRRKLYIKLWTLRSWQESSIYISATIPTSIQHHSGSSPNLKVTPPPRPLLVASSLKATLSLKANKGLDRLSYRQVAQTVEVALPPTRLWTRNNSAGWSLVCGPILLWLQSTLLLNLLHLLLNNHAPRFQSSWAE